jgi:hypothetical protein
MHIDAFDALFDQPQASPPETRATDYAVIPQGRAEVEIVAAEIGDVPWKVSDANPAGTCLKLRMSAGRGYAFVFADLPRDRTFLFKALAAALGIAPGPDGKTSLPQPQEMVGRTLAVEIGHYQTRQGETKATVRKWLPASNAATTLKAATSRPRAAATHRAAEQLPDDGVPF